MVSSQEMQKVLVILLLATIGHVISGLSPIIIIPGWGGTKLEARVSDGSPCDTGGKWVTVVYNPNMTTECVTKALTLQYDEATNTYSNSTDIELRVTGKGNIASIEYFDDEETIENYKELVDYFVNQMGYVRKETVRAAGFDWRLAPDTLQRIGYYDSLKALVEEMYEDANNEKVSIVVHSMGGPVTLYFFNNIVKQDWKDKYINVFVPLSAAWAGTTVGLKSFTPDFQMEDILEPLSLACHTMQGMSWLVPNPLIWKDEVILKTEDSSYTANDYKEIMVNVLNRRETDYDRIKLAHSLLGDYPSPNVPTHCLYGVGVPSIDIIEYKHGFPAKSITNGDGDGIVETICSEVCLKWSSQKQPLKAQTFEGVDHMEVTTSSRVLDVVAEAILNPSLEVEGVCEDSNCPK